MSDGRVRAFKRSDPSGSQATKRAPWKIRRDAGRRMGTCEGGRSLGSGAPNDLKTLAIQNRYNFAVSVQGPRPEAEALAQAAFVNCERVLGPSHPETGEAASILAEVYVHLNRLNEAVRLSSWIAEVMANMLTSLDLPRKAISNAQFFPGIVACRWVCSSSRRNRIPDSGSCRPAWRRRSTQ